MAHLPLPDVGRSAPPSLRPALLQPPPPSLPSLRYASSPWPIKSGVRVVRTLSVLVVEGVSSVSPSNNRPPQPSVSSLDRNAAMQCIMFHVCFLIFRTLISSETGQGTLGKLLCCKVVLLLVLQAGPIFFLGGA